MELDTSRLHPGQTAPTPPPPAPTGPAAKPPLEQPLTVDEMQDLQKRIVAALCTCFDPEVPVNIYELGLIYNVQMATDGLVTIQMTLTSPACPVAGSLPGDVQRKILTLDKVTQAKVDLVWDPPWDKSRMSEAAKLQLGIED